MDRIVAMLILLGLLVGLLLVLLALFSVAPVFTSCLVSMLYTLYLFVAHEGAGVHRAQEFENRFWTVFALLSSTALFFAKDSPICFGRWSPSLGFLCIIASGYAMHAWDRHVHRKEISREHGLNPLRRAGTATTSLTRLQNLGVSVEEHMAHINSCLAEIDQVLIPSTINNFLNLRYIIKKEREIISILEEAEPKALNYIISHLKLGLLFYKVKDHRNFGGMNRTEIIDLLAVSRVSVLSVLSRVLVLHALQMMKLPANARAEYWVRNILLRTTQDDLSDLKTLTDAKGDYFCMVKLLYDDIRSETVRQDILTHITKEAAIQQAHMSMNTRKAKLRAKRAWRKVLSDVDDTLTCSAGSYPAGMDRRYGKKVVYPGVLAFYRELDLGTQGPEEWPETLPGNLVFLSARPHVYKDVSEKHNFAKFQKLRSRGMHTMPSLLAGDMASGSAFLVQNNMEPLALKKYQNFKMYVSIYPEFKHVFIGDNGQGDARAGELMFDSFPRHLEALYIHIVQDISETHGYDALRWKQKGLDPCFFRTYPDAAIDAATRTPPLIRMSGLRRVCEDAVKDFHLIQPKQWRSLLQKMDRLEELNQGLWRANQVLEANGLDIVPLIGSERVWQDGEKVTTPYGNATIRSFDPLFDMYEVEIDWRPLDVQVAEDKEREIKIKIDIEPRKASRKSTNTDGSITVLETVVEAPEIDEELADTKVHIEFSLNQANGDVSGANSMFSTPRPVTPTKGENEAHDANAEFKSIEGKPKVTCSKCFDTATLPRTEAATISLVKGSAGHSDNGSIATSPTSLCVNGTVHISAESHEPQSPADGIHVISEDGVQDSSLDSKCDGAPNIESSASSEESGKPAFPHVVATLNSRCIRKYSPPELPVFPKESERKGSIFSFWQSDQKDKESKRGRLSAGAQCNTPYGPVTVVKDDRPDDIVVVTVGDWGTGYLRRDMLDVAGKGGFLSLRRLFSMKDTPKAPPPKKELEFPYAVGTVIQTPFGEGVVSRPLPLPDENKEKKDVDSEVPHKIESEGQGTAGSIDLEGDVVESPKKDMRSQKENCTTLGISLNSWLLADERHPMLYCTPEDALQWKNRKNESKHNLFSVFGTLVSKTVGRIKVTSSSDVKKASPTCETVSHKRYYQDGAAVTTQFGDGVVRRFRTSDGFYEISLIQWSMKCGAHPIAYVRQDSLSYRIAKGCQEGYPVLTRLGLSGILASVEPTTGVHVVTIPSIGMVCYLQPEAVAEALKAAVGEDVLTPFGEGVVRRYRVKDKMYEIKLHGWGGTLYALAEDFDRVDDRQQDREGPFGINWFLRYLFFSHDKEKKQEGSQRSRSNSIASLISVRSQSGKSNG